MNEKVYVYQLDGDLYYTEEQGAGATLHDYPSGELVAEFQSHITLEEFMYHLIPMGWMNKDEQVDNHFALHNCYKYMLEIGVSHEYPVMRDARKVLGLD